MPEPLREDTGLGVVVEAFDLDVRKYGHNGVPWPNGWLRSTIFLTFILPPWSLLTVPAAGVADPLSPRLVTDNQLTHTIRPGAHCQEERTRPRPMIGLGLTDSEQGAR